MFAEYNQPFTWKLSSPMSCDKKIKMTLHCRNSEIYNHDELKATVLEGVQIVKDSKSDSAIIGHLYEKLGDSDELWKCLDGIFACVVYDEKKDTFMAARYIAQNLPQHSIGCHPS